MWFKTNFSTSYQFLYSKSNGGTSGYELFLSSNALRFSACNSAGVCNNPWFDFTTTSKYTDNKWYHVVAVNDYGTNQKIYVNGVSVATSSRTGSVIPATQSAFIGARSGGSPVFYFNGTIDEVAIWNRELSSGEVSALYNNSISGNIKFQTRMGNYYDEADEDVIFGWYGDSCYDKETEILTEDGWKLFKDLENEKVATLNQKTGEGEYEIPSIKQEFEHEGDMYNIETEQGNLLVSPEHRVYVRESSNFDNSFVDTPKPISNSNPSYVQILQFNFDANATNSTSLRCSFNNCLASGINSLYSSNLTNVILFNSNSINVLNSGSESLDLSNISSLLLLNSSINFLGANICNLGLNITSIISPVDINVLNNTFESNTTLNYTKPLFFSFLSIDNLTLSDSKSAFSSVNLDLDTIDLNNLYSLIFLDIAPLAISDQFISGIDSISCFNSFGIANVNVGILLPPTVNTHNYMQIYKSFDSEETILEKEFIKKKENLNKYKLVKIKDLYNNLEDEQELFLDENLNEIKVQNSSFLINSSVVKILTFPS